MPTISRAQHFATLFPDAPRYRLAQIERAFFDPAVNGWDGITVLPQAMRQTLNAAIPWVTHTVVRTLESQAHDTYKSVLQAADGLRYETVLMKNARGSWTICVSSQIGCGMGCSFCATGTMGLKRSLTADEIVDQFRSWQKFLHDRPDLPPRISNLVMMGMGEPLANYENVKAAVAALLKNTDLGPTHLTVSTVGLLPMLEQLLTDPGWPPVRIAISLHSANEKLRNKIVPSTAQNFLPQLAEWSRRYQQTLGNRRRYLTFEYILLNGVNDSVADATELAAYLKTTGAKKINVIPYNPVSGKPFTPSQRERIDGFKNILLTGGCDVTERHAMGADIAAACGQLVYQPATPA
ncbi:MAG: 23S rRNA (adenine(2503)-C(2))-methyltransferase RlmN [Patescibacteria group bacterium]|nr:23S rRNA (adenine(2503)-C(2))-methyltransferase RlmN [Patescibacteria group bacterium]